MNIKKYTVFLREKSFLCSIGVYDTEKTKKQEVIISIELSIKLDKNKHINDDINNVYSYEFLDKKISDIIAKKHFNLLETLASEISVEFFKDSMVKKISISLHKSELSNENSKVGTYLEFSK